MIVRQEQALDALEMSDRFCGLSVHDWLNTATGFVNCRFWTKPAVVVIVVVPVGTVNSWTVDPVVIVVVVVTVL